MDPFRLADGTIVHVTGPTNGTAPLVVLLHGNGGDEAHMTNPNVGASMAGVIRDRNAPVAGPADLGIQLLPGVGVVGFEIDPIKSVGSWRGALNSSGFPTVSYTQNGGLIASSAAQLQMVAAEVLESEGLLGLDLVFLGHSRGGVIARQFLVNAANNRAFMNRVRACITLHSPNQGSSIADTAADVDAVLVNLQTALAGIGITAAGVFAMLRGQTSSPNYPELRVGSPILGAISAFEPVAGVEYHTFGGISTHFSRLRAHVFSPHSALPIPAIPPLFHWATFPVEVGVLMDPLSFLPLVPTIAHIQALMIALTTLAPELRHGDGDILVADSRAHLPDALTRTTNWLNHAEALYDPGLQAQVLGILQRFRSPLVTGKARVWIDPYPARETPAQHVVHAEDLISHTPVAGNVHVTDVFGGLAYSGPIGTPFTYGFARRLEREFDPETRRWQNKILQPEIYAELISPYPQLQVELGLR